ncbi:hypothetical protein BDZ91DRAFT_747553 [Kalaharituber pfeilii]|nr:hypothetical protein BDZ91DRAFT_747553 [Kalaharituber pfeilii]
MQTVSNWMMYSSVLFLHIACAAVCDPMVFFVDQTKSARYTASESSIWFANCNHRGRRQQYEAIRSYLSPST